MSERKKKKIHVKNQMQKWMLQKMHKVKKKDSVNVSILPDCLLSHVLSGSSFCFSLFFPCVALDKNKQANHQK